MHGLAKTRPWKKRRRKCPKCRSLDTERHGHWKARRARRPRQRFRCLACGATWSGPGRGRGALGRILARESLERTGIRTLSDRHGVSRQAAMDLVRSAVSDTPSAAEVAAALRPRWSGVLTVDGKRVRVSGGSPGAPRAGKMTWICGVDRGTGDLPHYSLADEETMIDLVLHFRGLKEAGYPLLALVSDGNPDVPRAARKVYGDGFVFQLCVRHFLEGLARRAREAGVADDRRVVRAIGLVRSVLMSRDLEQAGRRLERLRTARLGRLASDLAVRDFEAHTRDLTAHLRHPELSIPRTNNDAENLFRQLNQRLVSLGTFGRIGYAEDYLGAWALWRRSKPFTDCRGARKYRNGQSPLELAGCRPVDIRKIAA